MLVNMSADDRITSLLEVITFIITKLTYEEARQIKTGIFSDYFRKHLNLLDERKNETKYKEMSIKKQQNSLIEKQSNDLKKVIKSNDKSEPNLSNPIKEAVDHVFDNESIPKRPKWEQIQIPKQDLVIKAKTLNSLLQDKKRMKSNMDALNEKIFDSQQPTFKDQKVPLNQSQSSIIMNRTLTNSSGLQIDKMMAIRDSSSAKNDGNRVHGDKIHCPLCKRYYYISQRHYCFNVSQGKEICCNLCEKRFDSIKPFKTHFGVKHFQEYRDKVEKYGVQKCGTCLEEFENTVAMIVHVREEHEGKSKGWPMMPCPSCDKIYANADFLLEHIKDIHEKDETVLDYSGIIEGTYEVTEASAYYEEKKAIETNTRSMALKCRECGMQFSKNETLKAHENLH